MPESQNIKTHCSLMAPWMSMNITYADYCGLGCCNNHIFSTPFNSSESFKIMDLWNADRFQKLRNYFNTDNLDGSGCEQCACVTEQARHQIDTSFKGQKQISNYNIALEHAQRRDIEVRSYPVVYNICPSGKCNLKCIMCGERDRQIAASGKEIPCKALMDNIEALSHAQRIMLSGGEPLASEETTQFMKEILYNPAFESTDLVITTNGLLLDKYIKEFIAKPFINFSISIDSIGLNYEKIRRGGSWNTIEANIANLMEMREKYSMSSWKIQCNIVLMKSSIQTISKLVKWCINQGFDGFNFFPLEPTFENWNEDLVQNRHLLDKLPGYEEKLIDASNLLKKNGFDSEKAILSSYLRTLNCKPTLEQTLCSINRICIHDLFDKIDMNTKKIAIWGTGSFYRLHIADWLKEKAGQVDFIGFIDNNSNHWGKTCDGFPIYSPDEFKNLTIEPDFLIIALYIGWKNQVILQFREMGFNTTIVV